ncbi:Domain of unknown function DUF2520 [Thermaerobacter marianensis DSM 12885]|uniref:DUF2520 domain-containing protein n=2 Tax=Thermaerobacter marianensis TaxID=73919 RepID=E6SG78_THEM7|nr:Domain of unknown function DUF2520 [Thermaerobacter marianensis DSM 12885]
MAEGAPAPAVLLIGPGRAGRALALGWHAAGVPVPWVVGRREEPARDLARAVGGRALSWEGLLDRGLPGPWPPVVVLAVPDRAVEPAAEALAGRLAAVPPGRRPRYALHLSGALGLGPLASLERLGLAVEVFHPLLPLAGEPLPSGAAGPAGGRPGGPAGGLPATPPGGRPATPPGGPARRDPLAGAYVTVVYAPGQGRAPVGPALARALGATAVPWPGATGRQLALYHAAATLAANGVTALLWAAEELLRHAGYPGVGGPAAGPAGSTGGGCPAGGGPAPSATAAATAPAGAAAAVPSGPAAAAPSGPAGRGDPARPPEGAGARAPLLALAGTALRAVAERGPLAALTGPITRGDAVTVARHLEALEALAPEAGSAGGLDPGPAGRYRLAAALVLAAASRAGAPRSGLDAVARLLGRRGDGPDGTGIGPG